MEQTGQLPTKLCKGCNEIKPLAEFHKAVNKPRLKTGVQSKCKVCHTKQTNAEAKTIAGKLTKRRSYYKRVYGLSLEDIEGIFERQKFKCPICEKDLKDIPQRLRHLDHNHSNGKVVAILCNTCNQAIGLLQENVSNCMRAAQYLEIKNDDHHDYTIGTNWSVTH